MSDSFDKQALRSASLRIRAGITPQAAAAFAERLAKIGPELARAHDAQTVSAFFSIGDEPPTLPLLHALHGAGFEVALPVTGQRGVPLTFRRWTPAMEMVPGRMNIPEPPAEAEVLNPDVLFVPLAAFDRRGHRIGYGAGFYDLTLAALRPIKDVVAIGVAFAEQEVLFIPEEAHDEPLDVIVTDKDTIVCTDAG